MKEIKGQVVAKELHDEETVLVKRHLKRKADEENQLDIPLGQILSIKQNGSTSGAAMRARARAARGREVSTRPHKHKHAPSELPSTKPVGVYRDTLQLGKREVRDPRFSEGSGALVDGAFKKRYSFLYDETLPHEKKDIQNSLKKTKSERKRQELKAELARVTQRLKEEQMRRNKEKFEEDDRKRRAAERAAGKQPYYLKKSEKRRQELIAKYEELKKSGRLERFLEKRRKKNAAKDHKHLPYRRLGDALL